METYKEFTFEAAHKLEPYSGLHGHSFKVSVHLVGEPDPVYGWAANLYEVEKQIADIHKTLDHTYLNDIDGLSVPSLENLAKWIFDKLSAKTDSLERVEVKRGAEGQAEGCIYRRPHAA